MSEVAQGVQAERAALEAALVANPSDASAHVKMAQLEARLWASDPSGPHMAQVVRHLDLCLATLPSQNHPQVSQFATQLQKRGAPIGATIKAGVYPRLMALLSGKPVPAGAAPAAEATPPPEAVSEISGSSLPQPSVAERAEPAAPATPVAPAAPAPDPPPAPEALTPASQDLNGASGHAAPSPPPAPSRSPSPAETSSPDLNRSHPDRIFEEVRISEVSNPQIKEWFAGKQYRELASAYPMIDNFSIRRRIVDQAASEPSVERLGCLVHMLSYEHEEKDRAYVIRRIVGFGNEIVLENLAYDPHDRRYREAVVAIFAGLNSPSVIKPLTSAMRDREAEIRRIAIQGLIRMTKPCPEWIKELARAVKSDADDRVRLYAARAIKAIDTDEAFQALSQVAKDVELDKYCTKIYDDMHAKHMTGALEEQRAKAQGLEDETDKAKGGSGSMKMVGVVLVVAVLGAAGFFFYKNMAGGSSSRDLSDEEKKSQQQQSILDFIESEQR